MSASTLPQDLAAVLAAQRPDIATWATITKLLDTASLSPQQIVEVKQALSAWPREVPRKAPKEWQQGWRDDQARAPSCPVLRHHDLLSLCCDVTETESLYNYYIAQISTSPRLRLRDGSPAVTMWRQLRGRVQLQNGTSLALGEGQSGLADLGGIMTVELERRCSACAQRYDHTCARELGPHRLNLYVEAEIKICGNIPPTARECRSDSKRKLTDTEQDQVQRQQAQLRRGGFYCFADRTVELEDAFVAYRDDVAARLS